MKRCNHCILPESYPEIHFDEHGICDFCRKYKAYQVKGENALKELILAQRNKNSIYDCIVPLSGGRESSYVLYYLRKVLDLNPLAVQYDNDFVTEQAKKNISNAVSILGVDFISVKSKKGIRRSIAHDSFKLQLRKGIMPAIGSLCSHCWIGEESAVYGVSEKENVTAIVWGDSQEEITPFDPRLGHYQKTKADMHSRTLKKIGERLRIVCSPLLFNYIRLRYNGRRFKKEFCYDKQGVSPALRPGIHFFDYVEHDENRIVETVKREIKWDKPAYALLPWRFDCTIAIFGEYFKRLFLGFNKQDIDLSNMIRKGLMSREDALRIITVDEEMELKKIKSLLAESGFIDSDIQMIESFVRHAPYLSKEPASGRNTR